jgi:hypothetical protein
MNKKTLRSLGLFEAVVALIVIILLLCTHCVTSSSSEGPIDMASSIKGYAGIFGYAGSSDSFMSISLNVVVGAVINFVFLLLMLIGGILAFVIGIKGKEKVAGVFALVIGGLFLISAILVFCEVPMFNSANNSSSEYALGGGWLLSGILEVLMAIAGVALPILDKAGKLK